MVVDTSQFDLTRLLRGLRRQLWGQIYFKKCKKVQNLYKAFQTYSPFHSHGHHKILYPFPTATSSKGVLFSMRKSLQGQRGVWRSHVKSGHATSCPKNTIGVGVGVGASKTMPITLTNYRGLLAAWVLFCLIID